MTASHGSIGKIKPALVKLRPARKSERAETAFVFPQELPGPVRKVSKKKSVARGYGNVSGANAIRREPGSKKATLQKSEVQKAAVHRKQCQGFQKDLQALTSKGMIVKSRSKAARKAADEAEAWCLPLKPKQSSLVGAHKPVLLIFASAHLLGTACQISNIYLDPLWLPTALGASIGILYTILNRFGRRRYWKEPSTSLNVVITGSTRGIGKALARDLLKRGDSVMISSSIPQNVRQAMKELRAEVGDQAALSGLECNVSSPGAVTRLANAAASQMGSIDVWINNAGYSGRYQAFLETSPEQLQNVVQTNLVGSLLCARGAWRVMSRQPNGGHIFNIDGAGADGGPTPQYAAYGATKAAIAHLMGSLNEEAKGALVGVHTLSPGMVLTPLLLEGATARNKAVFNILCEQPETVAAFLTPRIRNIAARGGGGSYIRFLTLPTALCRFLSAPFASKRFFGREGQALYPEEKVRIMSPSQAKITNRLIRRAARRDKTLALAYSLSLALSYAIIFADTQGAIPRLPFS